MKSLALFILLGFPIGAIAEPTCASLFTSQEIRPLPEFNWYESSRIIGQTPRKDINNFTPEQGIFVMQRDKHGDPSEAIIRVLSDNPNNKIEVIGDFNNWGKSGTVNLHRGKDPAYMEGTIPGLRHGQQYRVVVNGQPLLDPSSLAYSTPEFNQKINGNSAPFLNSVFWDIEGEGRYQHQNPIPDLRLKPMSISETEIHALVAKWRQGKQLGPNSMGDTYNFIADSGIIPFLKSRGINAIEFLPFNAAADGDTWQMRYQVYGMFAVESKYGTPAEFARMVDKFNESGIAVVMDVLLGHYQYDTNKGDRALKPIGLANWKKADGRQLYGDARTQWGTFRYDYQNPYVRKFLIDSIINTIKYYHIGGIRFDNYDGIRFSPGGTEFIKELASAVRDYAPATWMNAEMFLPENAVTKRLDQGGHGMNSYNNGNFFWKVVRAFAQGRTEDLDMNAIRTVLRDSWQWNEALKLGYATNHDESANHTEGATGAYFATLVSGGGWQYVEGKTRVFGSLTMLASPYYMDMPQFRLLQEGSFSNNPDVAWENLRNPSQMHMEQYFADLSNYFINEPAFAPHNIHANIENHTDNDNKVISLERIDFATGKRVYIVINMGHRALESYEFGVSKRGEFHVAIDSDNQKYGGSGTLAQRVPNGTIAAKNGGSHGKGFSLQIPYLAPFGVVILEN